jgi:AraC-like DNA-binding protein
MASEMQIEEPGYELIASRLADVLFVHALRRHEIALAVGYETESAFAKVFKRHLGASPGVYRRRLRTTETAAQLVEQDLTRDDRRC